MGHIAFRNVTHGVTHIKFLPNNALVYFLYLVDLYGVPGAIRTHGLPLRRGTLYPAELRGLLTRNAEARNYIQTLGW